MFAPGSFLNGQYTVVGKVVSGMEFVDKIKRGEGSNGEVSNPRQDDQGDGRQALTGCRRLTNR